MAETTEKSTIIIMDDELYNIRWLIDYLEAQDYVVLPTRDANEALQLISEEIYRCIIVDLNVPMFDPLISMTEELGGVYRRYPGLLVAREARNLGYRDRQVIVYSVHRDVEVSEEADKLNCTYILKGRPKEMKAELDDVLAFDPTSDGI